MTTGRPRTVPRITITCCTCSKEFESKQTDRKFCSMKCYLGSEQFRAQGLDHRRALTERAKAAKGLKPDEEPTFTCLYCGKTETIPLKLYGEKKYCNRQCYRAYQALRFDRFIANPESLALPQNYDEFLTQTELPCLIDGCGWSGSNLSFHVNMAHGIDARKFKQMAGFNLSTGVISTELAQKFRDARASNGFDTAYMTDLRRRVTKTGTAAAYRSLEGKEHQAKADALMCKSEPIREITCPGCQKPFTAIGKAFNQKWCSPDCRNESYRVNDNSLKKIHPVICGSCNKTFLGDERQRKRFESSQFVACSYPCRQRRAGALARGTWKGT